MKPTLLDGATGTMLAKYGYGAVKPSYLAAFDNPDELSGIHAAYADAGAEIICANTFSVNRFTIEGRSVDETVARAIEIAKKSATGGKAIRVALDIGPIGIGGDSELYDAYAELVIAACDAGADLVYFETAYNAKELEIAVKAAKEACGLPVFASMTFETSGKTFYGSTVDDLVAIGNDCALDAIGINCSYGPDEIYPVFEKIAGKTNIPLIAKPNAGLPDKNGNYSLSPAAFATAMRRFIDAGALYIGGCCGTTPEFIRNLAAII